MTVPDFLTCNFLCLYIYVCVVLHVNVLCRQTCVGTGIWDDIYMLSVIVKFFLCKGVVCVFVVHKSCVYLVGFSDKCFTILESKYAIKCYRLYICNILILSDGIFHIPDFVHPYLFCNEFEK